MSVHLVIGSSGLVGCSLVGALSRAGLQVAAADVASDPSTQFVDIRDRASVQELLSAERPETVYLSAAQTNVDYCETNPNESFQVNVVGVTNVVRAAECIGARVVYFSSDYVFDGTAGPYEERDPINPICEYGRQKAYAEHAVLLGDNRHLIIRTTVVFGPEEGRKNFVYRVLGNLSAGKQLAVPFDQVGSPTYAPTLADAVISLAQAGASGIFHIAGPDRLSRYEFACETARAFNLPEDLIHPVPTSQLGQSARRPLQAGMHCRRIATLSDVRQPSCREGLQLMAKLIHANGATTKAYAGT